MKNFKRKFFFGDYLICIYIHIYIHVAVHVNAVNLTLHLPVNIRDLIKLVNDISFDREENKAEHNIIKMSCATREHMRRCVILLYLNPKIKIKSLLRSHYLSIRKAPKITIQFPFPFQFHKKDLLPTCYLCFE